MTRGSIDALFHSFEQHIELTAADRATMTPYLRACNVAAKTSLQAIGAPVKQHYFLVKGLVRLYYITPEGKDINKGFYSEGHIVGNLSGLILNEPSRFGIETLEPCELIEMDLRDFPQLMQHCHGWAQLFNQSCQKMLIRNERREAELLTLSAKARFRQFVKNFGDDMERIPQYHIASYLGVTPAALSRYKHRWLDDAQVCD